MLCLPEERPMSAHRYLSTTKQAAFGEKLVYESYHNVKQIGNFYIA